MTTHATAEVLSAYLDHELLADESVELEEHLESCSDCAARLAGMRSVVTRLHQLERLAPPNALDQLVARRIALSDEPRSLLDRLEDGLSGFQRQSNMLMLFAVVIALAVIMLLFAHALERAANDTIPVVFEGSATIAAPPGEPAADPAAGSGLILQRHGEDYVAVGEEGSRLEIAGRVLERRGQAWIERGLDPEAPALAVDWGTRAAEDLLAEHPGLIAVESLGEPVRLRLDGRAVLLRPRAGE